jgi:hypothetical protein
VVSKRTLVEDRQIRTFFVVVSPTTDMPALQHQTVEKARDREVARGNFISASRCSISSACMKHDRVTGVSMAASLETPILGAALTRETLALQRDWILEKQRDLEIQDFFSSETLDGDWRSVGAEIRRLLDGYTGRLGIHGPFWGFKIDSQDPLIRSVVTKRLLQGLEACEMVGATQMVIHSPFTTWDYNNLDINPGSRHALTERVHLTLKDVVQRAENIGCELVIENIEDKDPAARVLLARSFDSAAVRVSIDTDMRTTRMFPPVRHRSTITSMPPAMTSPTSTFRIPTATRTVIGCRVMAPCAGLLCSGRSAVCRAGPVF